VTEDFCPVLEIAGCENQPGAQFLARFSDEKIHQYSLFMRGEEKVNSMRIISVAFSILERGGHTPSPHFVICLQKLTASHYLRDARPNTLDLV
jgi:hypothetical protein